MSNCIKTGARVWIESLGGVVAADLFLVGTAVIVRYNERSLDTGPEAQAACTHKLTYAAPWDGEWDRKDLGVYVTLEKYLTEVNYEY